MTRKSIFVYYILFNLILSSCDNGSNSNHEKKSLIFHYSVSEILSNKNQYKPILVQFETKPIYKSFFKEKKDFPPPPGTLIFSNERFNLMVEKNFIKRDEADYMYFNIDSTFRFYIDSSKIKTTVITEQKIDSLFLNSDENTLKDLKSKYGTNSFIKFGTPLFNSDLTKVLVTTEIFSNSEMNQYLIYLLENRENEWIIKHELGLW